MKSAFLALTMTLLLISAVLAIAYTATFISQPPSDSANDFSNLAWQPHPGARLPLATPLIDEHGRTVTLADYFTKPPVVFVLDYLRCSSLCNVTLQNVVDALERLPLQSGRDYQLVTLSIDPRDKPGDAAAARAKYLAMLNGDPAGSGMHFLTGAPAAVQMIADIVGFSYRYDSLADAYIHPAGFVIASPDGVINRYVEGVAVSPRALVEAFGAAQQDKSQGPLTRLLLLCHVQGAPLGRFTVPVLTAFTCADIAAGLTLIAIFIAIRRRRHA